MHQSPLLCRDLRPLLQQSLFFLNQPLNSRHVFSHVEFLQQSFVQGTRNRQLIIGCSLLRFLLIDLGKFHLILHTLVESVSLSLPIHTYDVPHLLGLLEPQLGPPMYLV